MSFVLETDPSDVGLIDCEVSIDEDDEEEDIEDVITGAGAIEY